MVSGSTGCRARSTRALIIPETRASAGFRGFLGMSKKPLGVVFRCFFGVKKTFGGMKNSGGVSTKTFFHMRKIVFLRKKIFCHMKKSVGGVAKIAGRLARVFCGVKKSSGGVKNGFCDVSGGFFGAAGSFLGVSGNVFDGAGKGVGMEADVFRIKENVVRNAGIAAPRRGESCQFNVGG